MNTRIQKQTSKYAREHGFLKRWHEVLTVLAAVVVFFTTYALIMPAVTKTQETFCGIEQHVHDDSCFGKALTCWIPEEGHEHSEDCSEEQEMLVCGLGESEGHDHSEECFGEDGELICGEAESEGHRHNSGCYAMEEVLVCGQDEHGPHEHTDSCYSLDTELPICGKAVHEHVLQCFSDPKADVEEPEQWERSLERIRFTGSYVDNLIDVAKSQLGYTESEKNYIVLSDGKSMNGYTRYGQLAGKPYEPWNIDFAAFCVTYAEVDLPVDTDTTEWILALDESFLSAEGYEPAPGDLVFFDENSDFHCDRIGIVAEMGENADGITFRTIEGDVKNRVDYVDNQLADAKLMGYCRMPEDVEVPEETQLETETDRLTMNPGPISKDIREHELQEFTKTYESRSYTVTATYTELAEIPEEAVLIAAEYAKDSEIYQKRFAEAAALNGWPETEEYMASFRLFNIGLFVDGVEIQPKDEIRIVINYKDDNAESNEDCQVIHYGQEPVELDASFDGNRIDFVTDAFSDFGVSLTPKAPSASVLATSDALRPLVSNTFDKTNDLIAYFPFNSNITDTTGHATATVNSGRTAQYSTYYTVNGGALNLSGNNAGTYLKVLSKSGTKGLLAGYDEIAFDFWIRPTSRTENAWVYYASKTTDRAGWGTQNYIGGFLNKDGQGFKSERYLNGGSHNVEAPLNMPNNWIHVCVEYRKYDTRIVYEVYTGSKGNTNANVTRDVTVQADESLKDIIGDNPLFLIGTGNWNDNEYLNAYLDEFRVYAHSTAASHPMSSVTEEIQVQGVALYNVNSIIVDGNNVERKAAPLAGVEYTVYNQDGTVYDTYVTENTFYLSLGLMPPGTYTIEQTAVPEGYMVMPQRKTFTVTNNFDSYTEAGIFYDYPYDRVYEPKKLAEVYDYENRIYDINLSAYSGDVKLYIEKKNFNFVVDQSNSMLFPAVLTPAATVRLYSRNDGSTSRDDDAGGNSKRLDALGLDPNQVYYIVTNQTGSATVCAVWKSKKDGKWYIQDASYYVFAQRGDAGWKFADEGGNGVCLNGGSETAGAQPNACDLVNDINNNYDGNSRRNNTNYYYRDYTVYTGSEMNRLTYLKYAMKRMLYQIAAMGSENTVTISTFDNSVEACITRDIDAQHMAQVEELVTFIDGIRTDGGTAQNLGLWHLLGRHRSGQNRSGCEGNHIKSDENNYVILITDGALNRQSDYITGTNQTQDLINAGKAITDDPGNRLITIGLSVQDVTLAQQLLTDLDHGGIATNGYAFLDKGADELSVTLSNALVKDVVEFIKLDCMVDFRDYVSDSFYITDSKGNPLSEGTWITKEGVVETSAYRLYYLNRNPSRYPGYGKVMRDEKGWYIQWTNQTLKIKNGNDLEGTIWRGKFYVKAKEDFIGGNSIDTNKEATIDILQVDEDNIPVTVNGTKQIVGTIPFRSPNVNVHLLPMNFVESEQTVFYGDQVSVQQKIKDLFTQLYFTKLNRPAAATNPTAGYGDAIYNYHDTAASALAGDGLEDRTFTLGYAGVGGMIQDENLGWLQDLNPSQWSALFEEKPVTVPYSYDQANGTVGNFVLQLTKAGGTEQHPASLGSHEAGAVGYGVETYTLSISYEALPIGEGDGKRPTNVYNAENGPGTIVSTTSGPSLTEGYGRLQSDNIHRVNVVDGKVIIEKTIDTKLRDEGKTQEFTFTLRRQTSPGDPEEGTEPTYEDTRVSVAVPAGQLTGSTTLCELKRGTYLVIENTDSDAVYYPASIKVSNATGCVQEISSTMASFTIGNIHPAADADDHSQDKDVILQIGTAADGYRSIYSTLISCWDEETHTAQSTYGMQHHGVCYATVGVLNKEIPKFAEIPVVKRWNNVPESQLGDVYVALYKGDFPELDEKGNVQTIVLNRDNGWTDSFKVPLPDRNADVRELGYSVRELSGVSFEDTGKLSKAIVLNAPSDPATEESADGENEEPEEMIIYYKEIAADGKVILGNFAYMTSVTLTNTETDYYYTITNSAAYELPETGGMGTTPVYIAGFLLMAAACVYEFRPRRRSERRAG